MEVDALYYACIDRIDERLELAEEYLVGCVTFLYRQKTGRADRDRVAEDFSLNRGLEKYIEELTIISRLSDSAMATLIASSLDLAKELERLEDIHSKISLATYDDVEAHNQTSKIDKAILMLENMKTLIKDKGAHYQRGLFDDEDK